MLRASEHQLSKRIVMLQGVYEDNLHLGKLRRRRPSPPGPPARQRHWLSWALLGITLTFGPALGYLGPTVLVQSQKLETTDTQRKAGTHSFVASADNSLSLPALLTDSTR